MNPATEPKTTEAGAWITLPASADGATHKVLPAWHVDEGVTKICVIIAPIWVTQINRLEGFVTWRVPNQPFDVERTAPFASIHTKIESALAHAARLLPALCPGAPPRNQLQT